MENLPIEIQWNIIKFMRHPVAEMFMFAKEEHKDYIRYYDDAYSYADNEPRGPGSWLADVLEMTLVRYLRNEMRGRHSRNKFKRIHGDYRPEVEHAIRDYTE